jgi:hypothetical protein
MGQYVEINGWYAAIEEDGDYSLHSTKKAATDYLTKLEGKAPSKHPGLEGAFLLWANKWKDEVDALKQEGRTSSISPTPTPTPMPEPTPTTPAGSAQAASTPESGIESGTGDTPDYGEFGPTPSGTEPIDTDTDTDDISRLKAIDDEEWAEFQEEAQAYADRHNVSIVEAERRVAIRPQWEYSEVVQGYIIRQNAQGGGETPIQEAERLLREIAANDGLSIADSTDRDIVATAVKDMREVIGGLHPSSAMFLDTLQSLREEVRDDASGQGSEFLNDAKVEVADKRARILTTKFDSVYTDTVINGLRARELEGGLSDTELAAIRTAVSFAILDQKKFRDQFMDGAIDLELIGTGKNMEPMISDFIGQKILGDDFADELWGQDGFTASERDVFMKLLQDKYIEQAKVLETESAARDEFDKAITSSIADLEALRGTMNRAEDRRAIQEAINSISDGADRAEGRFAEGGNPDNAKAVVGKLVTDAMRASFAKNQNAAGRASVVDGDVGETIYGLKTAQEKREFITQAEEYLESQTKYKIEANDLLGRLGQIFDSGLAEKGISTSAGAMMALRSQYKRMYEAAEQKTLEHTRMANLGFSPTQDGGFEQVGVGQAVKAERAAKAQAELPGFLNSLGLNVPAPGKKDAQGKLIELDIDRQLLADITSGEVDLDEARLDILRKSPLVTEMRNLGSRAGLGDDEIAALVARVEKEAADKYGNPGAVLQEEIERLAQQNQELDDTAVDLEDEFRIEGRTGSKSDQAAALREELEALKAANVGVTEMSHTPYSSVAHPDAGGIPALSDEALEAETSVSDSKALAGIRAQRSIQRYYEVSRQLAALDTQAQSPELLPQKEWTETDDIGTSKLVRTAEAGRAPDATPHERARQEILARQKEGLSAFQYSPEEVEAETKKKATSEGRTAKLSEIQAAQANELERQKRISERAEARVKPGRSRKSGIKQTTRGVTLGRRSVS